MKKPLISAVLSLAISAPAFAAGPQQGNYSFSLFRELDVPSMPACMPVQWDWCPTWAR